MKIYLYLLASFLCIKSVEAQDSLIVSLNKEKFVPGDTILTKCKLRIPDEYITASTLNVWIEAIGKDSKWKLRYPVTADSLSIAVALNKNLPDGYYAFNFLLQPEFLHFKGKVKDYNRKKDPVNLFMITKNNEEMIFPVNVDKEGNFKTSNFVFEDSARFIFAHGVKNSEDIFIDLENDIDSAFLPTITNTAIVKIGSPIESNLTNTTSYQFNQSAFWNATLVLPEALIKTKMRKQAEKFNKEYATGLFKNDGIIFDGLENPELGQSKDIFTFLSNKLASLQIKLLSDGKYAIRSRGYAVDIFLDEQRMTMDNLPPINPLEVAMIKVFEPFHGPGIGNNSSIAIYTRKGNDVALKHKHNNIFDVAGYTPLSTVLE